MRIFVTGATGFIGSTLVSELIHARHEVLGLTRSEAGAEKLRVAGAEVLHGNLEDLDSLRKGAANSEGVIHLAFNYDFSQLEKSAADEQKAIAAMGEVLAGSNRPFIVTSATAMVANPDGKLLTEEARAASWNPRASLETLIQGFTTRGIKTSIVRLPQVHDTRKQGFVPFLTAWARKKGISAYVGEGSNRWPAAHVSDVARLYRLAIEKADSGAIYHAVDEVGVTLKAIAEALGRGLKVPAVSITPEKAEAHFEWLSRFVAIDNPASSAITQQKLNWIPLGPKLITDLDSMDYSQS